MTCFLLGKALCNSHGSVGGMTVISQYFFKDGRAKSVQFLFNETDACLQSDVTTG